MSGVAWIYGKILQGCEFMKLDYIADIIDRQLSEVLDREADCSDLRLRSLISEAANPVFQRTNLGEEEKTYILHKIFNGRRKLGVIQPFLEDSTVNEIMINGTGNIFVERDGRLEETGERFRSRDSIFHVVQTMAALSNRTVNESMPVLDGRLADGSRLNVVLYPVALNGPAVTIRKFPEENFTLEELIAAETLSAEEGKFLKAAVKAGYNIFISGGTSSGKTTFLNVLSTYIPEEQRVITIEDSAELRLSHKNLVRLETKLANADGYGEINMRDLIKASLRMRPDRLIIGEVRDESAADMLQALCTGHEGSMSTGHANSPEDMLLRLETMALWEGHLSSEAVRRQLATGIDLIIQLKRDAQMCRKVDSIVEVTQYANGSIMTNPIFRSGQMVGKLTHKAFKMQGVML